MLSGVCVYKTSSSTLNSNNSLFSLSLRVMLTVSMKAAKRGKTLIDIFRTGNPGHQVVENNLYLFNGFFL